MLLAQEVSIVSMARYRALPKSSWDFDRIKKNSDRALQQMVLC